MPREVKLSRIETVLADLSYPVPRAEAAAELDDVVVLLADGSADLGDLVERTPSETFESVDDLASDLNNVLPREAVGEPYQSEGEG